MDEERQELDGDGEQAPAWAPEAGSPAAAPDASSSAWAPERPGTVAGFAPPVAPGRDDGVTRARAGFWWRFLAVVIDGVILAVVQVVLRVALGGAGLGLSILIGIAYSTYLEGSPSGQTVGKRAVSIRVVSLADGGSIGYGRAFGRYFARFLSTIPIFLGYFWMLWDGERQTWHDKLVGSVVVPTASAPVERWPG